MKRKISNNIKNVEKESKLDESEEIKKFMIILITMIILVAIIFIFTKYVINDGDIKLPYDPEVTGAVNYDVVTVGTMLNKSDEEYYVIIYDDESVNAALYANIVGGYLSQEDPLPVYYSDKMNNFNSKYLATEENPENTNPKVIEDLAIGEFAFIKIAGGKISKYISTVEELKTELNLN